MRGGFKTLVNPPTKVSEIDIEGTRDARAAINALIRNRNYEMDCEAELLFRNRHLMGLMRHG